MTTNYLAWAIIMQEHAANTANLSRMVTNCDERARLQQVAATEYARARLYMAAERGEECAASW